MDNILFNKRVRSKSKSFFNIFFFSPYYRSEKISLKEKLYTFWYNLERLQGTTQGEMEWELSIRSLSKTEYEVYQEQFKEDYLDYLKEPK